MEPKVRGSAITIPNKFTICAKHKPVLAEQSSYTCASQKNPAINDSDFAPKNAIAIVGTWRSGG